MARSKSKAESDTKKKKEFACPYYGEGICTHPRCIRGCGNDCKDILHVTGHGTYHGKNVWLHR